MKQEISIPEKLFLTHGKEIEGIFRHAVREALLRHKKLGESVAVWKDGKVVILSSDEIILPEDNDEAQSLRPPQ
jgi:hypothetical protein